MRQIYLVFDYKTAMSDNEFLRQKLSAVLVSWVIL